VIAVFSSLLRYESDFLFCFFTAKIGKIYVILNNLLLIIE